MRRTSFLLATIAILGAASVAAWLWCSSETTSAFASSRDEASAIGRPVAPAGAALVASTDAHDADRTETGDEFDDKHYVRIPTRDLRIHVFDATDQSSIEGVTFTLDRYEVAGLPSLGEARSGSDGMTTFTLPTDRMLHLTVSLNRVTLEVVPVPDEPFGTPEQPFELALLRGATIHGRLFGPSGEPVPAERIMLSSDRSSGEGLQIRSRQRSLPSLPSYPARQISASEEPRSQEKNEFQFENVPAEEEIELRVSYGDHGDRQDSLTLCLEPGERREIEWHLGSRSSLAGRIVDDAGEPVAGASVHLSERFSFSDPGDGGPKSDANGEFLLGDLNAGRCVVDVGSTDSRHAHGSFMCTLAPGESRRGVVIELARAAPLVVRARLSDGNVPTDVSAYAGAPSDRFTAHGRAVSGADGTVTIEAVPLGEVDVEAFARSGPSETSGRVRFLHDGEHECVVDCGALATLRGSVELASGKPVTTGVQVALIRRGVATPKELFRSGTQSKSDEFEIKGIRAGEFDVVASTPDGRIGVVPSVSLVAGEQREGVVVRVEPGATLRVLAPSIDVGSTVTLRHFDFLDVRVLRDGACVECTSVEPGRHCELVVPSGRLTVEFGSSAGLLASREIEAHPYEVLRLRF